MTKEQAKAAALRWLDEATSSGLALGRETTADLEDRMDHLLDGAVAAVCGRFPHYAEFLQQPQPEAETAYLRVVLPEDRQTVTQVRLCTPDGCSLPFSGYQRVGRGIYTVPADAGGVLAFTCIRLPQLPGAGAAAKTELDVPADAAVLVPLRLAADVLTGADETAALAAYLAARYNDMAAALARRPETDCAAVECVYAQ